ncbi:MAG: hypothetical protein ACI8RZ_004835 [Myxococcota bacterium]|jgi:hypothetical protein
MIGILLPAIFAGLVATAATVAVERWGGRIGGLLSTLPTTIVPASIGIAAQSTAVDGFQDAMAACSAGMLVDVLFLYFWRIVPPRLPDVGLWGRLSLMLVVSLSGWLVAAAGITLLLGHLSVRGAPLLLIGSGLVVVTAGLGILACLRNPPSPAGRRRVGPGTLLARGVLAGVAIAGAVWLASIGGAVAAGIASVFPAIFLTTMVSLWISQGEAVQSGAVGPMMLGASSVSSFALVAALTIPAFGAGWGSLLAWILAVGLVTVPAWRWLEHRAVRAQAQS